MPEDQEELQKSINEAIELAMTSWVRGKVKNADTVDLLVTCHSNRYISFNNSFVFESEHIDIVKDYVTIDLLTGKRVYLDDLIKVNEEFVTYLQDNGDKILDAPHPMFQNAPDLSVYTTGELLEELKKCSYTQEKVLEDGYYPLEESIGDLLFRNSFFLREGILVITIERGGECYITLDINDIKDFLKVDRW